MLGRHRRRSSTGSGMTLKATEVALLNNGAASAERSPELVVAALRPLVSSLAAIPPMHVLESGIIRKQWMDLGNGAAASVAEGLGGDAVRYPEYATVWCEAASAAAAQQGSRRVMTACAADLLDKAAFSADRYAHLGDLVHEMLRFTYATSSAEDIDEVTKAAETDPGPERGSEDWLQARSGGGGGGGPSSLVPSSADGVKSTSFCRLLASEPYYERAARLQVRVNQLVSERRVLEAEEALVMSRRSIRVNVTRRLINGRIGSLMRLVFACWATTTQRSIKKSAQLIQYARNLLCISVRDVFRCWHRYLVDEKLKRVRASKVEFQIEMGNLEAELVVAKAEETRMEGEVKSLTTENEQMEAELKRTLEAIHRQRVPETMAVIKSAAEALKFIGSVIIEAVDPMLEAIRHSVDYEKLARVYLVEREEAVAMTAETKQSEDDQVKREQSKALQLKRERDDKRWRERAVKRAGKEKVRKCKEAAEAAEEDYKRRVESGEVGRFQKADMEAQIAQAQKEAEKEVQKELSTTLKEHEQERKNELAAVEEEAVRVAEKSERAFMAALKRKEKPGTLLERDVNSALAGLLSVQTDVLLLRWLKYHLRRATRSGYPFRRKCENYRDDFRDGTVYAVLMKRLLPEEMKAAAKAESCENMDTEIDPQTRLDAMMAAVATGTPSAAAFATKGHIYGNTTFLNASLLARLMLTRHGLDLDVGKGTEFEQLTVRRDSVKQEWAAQSKLVAELGNWDRWVQIRGDNDDAKLRTVLKGLDDVVARAADLTRDITAAHAKAMRGRVAWAAVTDRIQSYLWLLFASRTLQEDEAPPGVDIDPAKGHAPYRTVDVKFERKFVQYTKTRADRVRRLLDEARMLDLIKKGTWEKEDEERERAVAERRKPEPERMKLSEAEIEKIRVDLYCPLNDAEVKAEVMAIEKVLRKYYFDLSRVFKYYAAGGEAGASTEISQAEFWAMCVDCYLVGGDPKERIEKHEIEMVFARTEDEDELGRVRRKTDLVNSALKAVGSHRSVSSLGNAGADDDGDDDDDDEDGDGDSDDSDDGGEDDPFKLGGGEREIKATQWVEGMVHIALLKFPQVDGFSLRFERMVSEFVLPFACKSNTETFRGELSLDEVQNVYKKFKPQLMMVFLHYARKHDPVPGQPPMEPSLDGAGYLRLFKESKVVTRKGDLRDDYPELAARKVFQNSQTETSGDSADEPGGGDDQMIYMEFLESLAGAACYKSPNPYIPMHIKVEELCNFIFAAQVGKALPKPKAKRGKGKKKKK